ncbi:hypothetical protein ACFL0D_03470 [Thermoproteota archaeon]
MEPSPQGFDMRYVDARAELRRLQGEDDGAHVMTAAGSSEVKTLNIQSESIIEKVALNPQVFWCYHYVSSVPDPTSGKVLFGGDFGDYVSWATTYATEKFYGVSPMYATDMPSE